MADSISKEQRSALMAKVRSTGNRSTEGRVEVALKKARIRGWKKHPKDIAGCPDFYFPKARLVIFVDGCFWHACPKCGRLPSSNAKYWIPKLDANRRRDNRTRRQLQAQGFHVIRIWEHEVKDASWLVRVERMIDKHDRNIRLTLARSKRR
jgi:DNA mismatch endonuclease, patch repair protein